MSKDVLLKYLSFVKDMESNLYMLKLTESNLINRIDSLGIPNKYQKPIKPANSDDFDAIYDVGWMIFGFGIGGGIIGVIAGIIRASNANGERITTFFSTFVTMVIIGAILGLVFFIVSNAKKTLDDNHSYSNELKKYQNAIENDKLRVKEEKQEKSFLYHELTNVQNTIAQVKKDLEKSYSLGIIYDSYRNLCAVSSFYEYIASGICNSLEGADGAIKLYRNEMLQGRIIDSLNNIQNSLEQIKINQEMLYYEVQKGNQISQQLLNSSIEHSKKLNRLTEVSELQANNQAIIKSDVGMLTWISALNSNF
ncbi:MAG: hypothetical protein IJT36_00415 [Alphaproteobacteria bacterium]|nr:hypothetical protein [Alphaproteobacteria bacterium]